MRVLVTGHVGFIGSHMVKYLLANTNCEVIGFSRHSEARNSMRLSDRTSMRFSAEGYDLLEPKWRHVELDWSRLRTVWGDLTNAQAMSGLCEGIDVVLNFAAKTFVDHSLKDRQPFIESNIIGADNLMEDATRYGVKRFVQVSTDEVYGQILEGAYKEDAVLQPRNPYSWSKACADLNAVQRHRTYGFPAIVTRTENNFGRWQHRQKVLPTFVRYALGDAPLPVYGDGQHVRCWLYVEEHCRAIWHLVERSLEDIHSYPVLGEVFHIAGEEEMTNLALAKFVLRTLGKPVDRIRHIDDHDVRPGHDRRYALNCDKLRSTGFVIKQDLEERLEETIYWYRDHPEWAR